MIRHAILLGLAILAVGFVTAHLAPFALAAGLLVGFGFGSRHGRRRATYDAAREIVGERARHLGGMLP